MPAAKRRMPAAHVLPHMRSLGRSRHACNPRICIVCGACGWTQRMPAAHVLTRLSYVGRSRHACNPAIRSVGGDCGWTRRMPAAHVLTHQRCLGRSRHTCKPTSCSICGACGWTRRMPAAHQACLQTSQFAVFAVPTDVAYGARNACNPTIHGAWDACRGAADACSPRFTAHAVPAATRRIPSIHVSPCSVVITKEFKSKERTRSCLLGPVGRGNGTVSLEYFR